MNRPKAGFWTRLWFLSTICLLGCTSYLVVKVQDYKRRWWTSRLSSAPMLQGNSLPAAPSGVAALLLVGDSRVESWNFSAAPKTFFVINRGGGGMTSGEVLAMLKADLHSGNAPEWAVVQCGINDILGAGYDLKLLPTVTDRVIHNLTEIKDLLVRGGSRVILSTVIPHGSIGLRDLFFWTAEMDTAVGTINEAVRKMATDRTLILDAAQLLADGNRTKDEYCDDGLHLNDAGYQKLSDELDSFLGRDSSN